MALLALIPVPGCGSVRWFFLGPTSEERFVRSEETYREDMAQAYPPGTPREELSLPEDWPIEHWDCTEPATDRFAQFAYAHAVATSDQEIVSCDSFPVWRTSIASVLGAFGLYTDFVFFDRDDRVVVGYRRFDD